jgi:peptide chain release factor 1
MLRQIEHAAERFREIDVLLSSPGIHADIERYTGLLRERKQLLPLVEKYREYEDTEADIEAARKMAESEPDAELREMAAEEAIEQEKHLDKLKSELLTLLLAQDPYDDRNVILEIRAGAGGEEAALFAADLFRMYSMYAERRGYRVELLETGATELGGYRLISALISGEAAFSHFKYESGVHRVQRVPVTESQGRIQTSTVTVAVLPEVEEVEIEIRPEDVQMESCKSSGAGGQHINKTESAVRLTHKPSGIVVECQEERSQFKNKDKALKMLRSKLFDIKQREQDERIASDRKSQVGTGDRSERIRTYNYPQGRISDHRIGLTLYTLEDFLNGDLDPVVDALLTAETAEKLKHI